MASHKAATPTSPPPPLSRGALVARFRHGGGSHLVERGLAGERRQDFRSTLAAAAPAASNGNRPWFPPSKSKRAPPNRNPLDLRKVPKTDRYSAPPTAVVCDGRGMLGCADRVRLSSAVEQRGFLTLQPADSGDHPQGVVLVDARPVLASHDAVQFHSRHAGVVAKVPDHLHEPGFALGGSDRDESHHADARGKSDRDRPRQQG
jgi:hypothetical protein